MVIGQNGKAEDIELNVCKTKHLTNTRSSSADDALKLVPPKKLSLEEALEFIDTDELLEITPENLRIRKKSWIPHSVSAPEKIIITADIAANGRSLQSPIPSEERKPDSLFCFLAQYLIKFQYPQ